MKKLGFTLAEILVILVIIGVVVALALPAAVNNIQMNKNMSVLSKTVADLDNAFTSAMVAEHANDVFTLSFWPERDKNNSLNNASDNTVKQRFNGNASKYLNFTVPGKSPDEIYGGVKYYKLSANGQKGQAWNNVYGQQYVSGTYPIIMKNGSIVFLRLIQQGGKDGRLRPGETKKDSDGNDIKNYILESEALEYGTTLRCAAGYATIDANGSSGPNTVGRDIFIFIIGQNGHFYPYGGTEYTKFEKKGDVSYIWNKQHKKNNNLDGYTCQPEEKAVSVDGMGCTGRVVEEGYKMTY